MLCHSVFRLAFAAVLTLGIAQVVDAGFLFGFSGHSEFIDFPVDGSGDDVGPRGDGAVSFAVYENVGGSDDWVDDIISSYVGAGSVKESLRADEDVQETSTKSSTRIRLFRTAF
jgi:hypothetical protein